MTTLHEMDLDDFWRHPVGWDVVMARLEAVRRDKLDKAARSLGDEHGVKFGELRGFEDAIAALLTWRREATKELSA